MARMPSSELLAMHARTVQHQGRLAPSTNGRDRLRLKLYTEQNGECYWHQFGQCRFKGAKMSLDRTYISDTGKVKNNGRFASFEHLKRRYDGGTNAASNMRLAHVACNCHREKFLAPNTRPKKVRQPEEMESNVG